MELLRKKKGIKKKIIKRKGAKCIPMYRDEKKKKSGKYEIKLSRCAENMKKEKRLRSNWPIQNNEYLIKEMKPPCCNFCNIMYCASEGKNFSSKNENINWISLLNFFFLFFSLSLLPRYLTKFNDRYKFPIFKLISEN